MGPVLSLEHVICSKSIMTWNNYSPRNNVLVITKRIKWSKPKFVCHQWRRLWRRFEPSYTGTRRIIPRIQLATFTLPPISTIKLCGPNYIDTCRKWRWSLLVATLIHPVAELSTHRPTSSPISIWCLTQICLSEIVSPRSVHSHHVIESTTYTFIRPPSSSPIPTTLATTNYRLFSVNNNNYLFTFIQFQLLMYIVG